MTVLLDVAEVLEAVSGRRRPGPLARFKRRFSGGPEKLPKVYAVDDVSFVIDKGETVGLVGESGCGKSTLVRALTRLIDVSDGSIKLGDRELSLKPARVFARDRDRARIQMVFQDAGESVNPRFTGFRRHRRSAAAAAQAARQGAAKSASRPWRPNAACRCNC